MRIGLTYSAWKADVLPLNYARKKDYLYIIQKIYILQNYFLKNTFLSNEPIRQSF